MQTPAATTTAARGSFTSQQLCRHVQRNVCHRKRPHRPSRWVWPRIVLALFVLASCGSDGESPSAVSDASLQSSEDVCRTPAVRGYGFDRFGGWKGIRSAPTGRFRVERVDGVWWFVTPDGHVLFSAGVTGVDPVGDYVRGTDTSPYLDQVLRRHGSLEAWADSTTQRLCALGFRVLGGWMGAADLDLFAERFPYTVNVDFYEAMPAVRGGSPSLRPRRDVFVPDALERARALAAEHSLVQRCARDPWCVGVYVENEVPYLPSLLAGGGHLDVYLAQAQGSPGKMALEQFFRERYAGDVGAFNRVWGTQLADFSDLQQASSLGNCPAVLGVADDLCYLREPEPRRRDRVAFEARVAERVAETANQVLREASASVLNLGPRIVTGPFAEEVVRALARPVDVFSTNNYDITAFARSLLPTEVIDRLPSLGFTAIDPFQRLRDFWKLTGKPVLVTEWFYRRARPDGSFPPFLPEVPDGPAQAAAARAYMEEILQMPFVVGAHWFQWVDQPKEGRRDGENQLIGIVDIEDNLNEPLASTLSEVNHSILLRRLSLAQ
ncbi:MAG: hypothetical protein N3C12_05190 [Candidatus Binatia bacterium]|nr:hypothetical protein [Candidatus Binatia bacterium]